MSWRTRTATGSASGHTSDHVHAHQALTPPMTSTAPRSRSRIAPLVGAPHARLGRTSEPSRRDTLRRERPPIGEGGCGTLGGTPSATPPLRRAVPAAQKGGSLPSCPSPLARVGNVRPRTKNTNNDSATMKGDVWYTPPLCFWYTTPSVCVPFYVTPSVTPIVTPERSRRRGTMARVTMPPRD